MKDRFPMSTIEYVYTVLFWFSFFFPMSHSIWISHFFFQIHTSIYSSGHSRTGWKAFGHVQLSHKRRSVAGMLITHWTTQCIIVERVHRTKVCKVWTRSRCILYKTVYRRQMLCEVILVISRSNYGFTFVRFSLTWLQAELDSSRSYNHYQSYMWLESLHCRLCQEQAWKSYKRS